MIMASSEPWITLGRTYDDSLALLSRSDREVYGAFAKDELLGFVVIVMTGAFVGYVQTVAVRAADRSRGVGSALVKFAEERIFAPLGMYDTRYLADAAVMIPNLATGYSPRPAGGTGCSSTDTWTG